ncbi:MAG TPA: sulfatase-like hydrolase/transferase [Candidatus Aminicenantes bacterium]|nr:sulfatase-like hydrolase/transferase [Candidatus Aminicenantes bacterium]HRY64995.1 sulfatase-like hydrolase/transferase [Candidatus Aminicenantes bacterium]HRZ71908.1 sulfatase-like hydrolase/transferase [Candidatus Aminicenantes bacterium]
MKSPKVLLVAAAGIVLAGVAAVGLLGPARSGFGRLTRGRDFNVVLVTLDTVRADALGCYGRRDVETPVLDAWAAAGVRFDRCYAQTPLTLASHATLLTGTQPLFHRVRDNGAFVVPAKMSTLAELFKEKGYSTGAFVGAYVLDSRWGLGQGFDVYHDKFDLKKYRRVSLETVRRPADEVLDAALPWLEGRQDGPFFAWIHLYDPHAPYLPPPPYDARYADRPYLGAIAFVDAQLGRLRRFLETAGLIDRTFIVVAGDHGEMLGEHGETTHGFFLYQAALRVPLIVVTPFARFRGRVAAEPAGLVDVLPTVCRMAGLRVPDEVQGRSLTPAFSGRGGKPPLVYSETFYPRFHFGWSELESVQDGRWKLILAPEPELYDLAADPREETNLAGRETSVFRGLKARAEAFMDRAGRNAYEMDAAKVDAATRERLAALGYVGSFTDPAKLAGKALADPKEKISVYNALAEARETARDGRPDEAAGAIRRIVADDPQIPDAHFTLGSLLVEQGKLEEAIAAFKRVLEIKPDEGFAALNVVTCYERLGRKDEAERFALDYLGRGIEEPHLYAWLGAMKLGRKEYDQAAPYFERAIELDAEPAGSLEGLGAIAMAGGDLARAEGYLRRAAALEPDRPNLRYRIGWIAEKQGRTDEAEAEYRAELRISPQHFQALYNLARIYDAAKDYGREREALEKAVTANPGFALTYFYLARLHLTVGERYPEAIALVRRGMALGPEPADLASGYLLLAELYGRVGDAARSSECAAKGRALAAAGKKRP